MHQAWPREIRLPGVSVVLMADLYATAVALLALFWLGRWFMHCVHQNRMDRRQLYDPWTTGPWVRARGRYDDLSETFWRARRFL